MTDRESIGPSQIAKHLRNVHLGGNWTSVNLKDTLTGVTWQQAITQVHGLNTIATLVFHINYFIEAVIPMLQGGMLNAKDSLSFAHPPIEAKEDWDAMVARSLANAQTLAQLTEKLPGDRLKEVFADEKYGTYYRNLQGIIEHTHYHLGQIAIIKKIVQG